MKLEGNFDYADTASGKECDQHTTNTQMIRAIQQSRGDEPCFASDKRHDCAEMCEWRQGCRKHVAAWLR